MAKEEGISNINWQEKILEHFGRFKSLEDEDKQALVTAFKPTQIRKRQFLTQPGYTARYRNFVVKGAFKGYVVDESGTEQIIQFAIEDWWISDYNSFIFQQPATMFVEALEDSFVLQLDHHTESKLKQESHRLESIFRMMAERSTAFMQRRIVSNLTKPAEARYEEFLEKYPLLVNRVPQYAIASYLGFSTEFLSRLRNRKSKKLT